MSNQYVRAISQFSSFLEKNINVHTLNYIYMYLVSVRDYKQLFLCLLLSRCKLLLTGADYFHV